MKNTISAKLGAAACGALLIIGSATPAFAIERLLSIGQNGFDAGTEVIQVQANDTFLIDLAASRSYVCEGIATVTDSDFDWDTSVVGTTTGNTTPITATATGDVVPIVAGETGGVIDNRISVTPTVTDRYRITVASARSGGEPVRVRCFATTLFGDFNTNVNDFNFLELKNIGNKTITGTITAIDFAGNVALNAVEFSVAAQRRFDIDLHTPVGADKYGIVRVTHNAPLGTLVGTVSQYQGTVTDFSLTATVPMVPFDQGK